ncbi:MAG: hypothetical protein HOV80_18180 [Polyangiaceae bacterium]|nr:hypothetical protein [Polyangiaceae bacterium]
MAATACIHLTARSAPRRIDCSTREIASWLWPRLREAFPRALAAVVMPDHVHIVTPFADRTLVDLARVLGNCARGPAGVNALRWMPADAPSRFDDPIKIARNVRYVALNPVRAGLVSDPLSWLWSTHRDVVGATVDPWVTEERLAAALGWSHRHLAEDWHAYVTKDAGAPPTPPPRAFEADVGEAPLSWIATAASSATRSELRDISRRSRARTLFLALSRRAGWRSPSLVAARCNITERAVRKAWAHPPPAGLDAALLCLGDSRLRV